MSMRNTKPGCGTILCWSLSLGLVFPVLFAVGLFAYSELITDGMLLDPPRGHGAWGITEGQLVFVLGTPAALIAGIVVGAVIGAKRA